MKLLRHTSFVHILRFPYVMFMSPPNLKHISQKTRSQWPKTPKIDVLRHKVATSLRHDVRSRIVMRLCHVHVSIKFDANRLKNIVLEELISELSQLSPTNIKIYLRIGVNHDMHPCISIIYAVSKYEEDRVRKQTE